MDLTRNIEAAIVFAFLGIVVFVAAFAIIDRMTPYHLWNEIVHEICIIIAAAVH
jgi:putative membrane protein